jgi:hypothetical protein
MHNLGESSHISRMSRDITGDRRPVVDGKHLKADGRPAPGIEHCAQNPSL